MYITGLKAFEDSYNNYIWCILPSEEDKEMWVVDPGDASPVLDFINKNNKILKGILVTHHHGDHTGGIEKLQSIFPKCEVIASHKTQKKLPNLKIDTLVKNGDEFLIFGRSFSVIETPGHTLDHIVFYNNSEIEPILFSGDTLFTAGCGLVFEGTAEQMATSLIKLRNLKNSTLVYCAHEYTLANINFAKIVEADNTDISNRRKDVIANFMSNTYSVPARLELEKKTNPFLRFDLGILQDIIYDKLDLLPAKKHKKNLDFADSFHILRLWKNQLDKTDLLNRTDI